MKPISEIDKTELFAAVDELNESGLLEKKIAKVGQKPQAILEAFAAAIEALPEESEAELTELAPNAVEFYNENVATDEDGEGEVEGEEEPAEEEKPAKAKAKAKAEAKGKPEKKEKPAKAKPEKKEGVKGKGNAANFGRDPNAPKSRWGHTVGTGAAMLDELCHEGKMTIVQMAEKIGTTASRVKNHLHHLKADKGLTVDISDKGIVKVTEPKGK